MAAARLIYMALLRIFKSHSLVLTKEIVSKAAYSAMNHCKNDVLFSKWCYILTHLNRNLCPNYIILIIIIDNYLGNFFILILLFRSYAIHFPALNVSLEYAHSYIESGVCCTIHNESTCLCINLVIIFFVCDSFCYSYLIFLCILIWWCAPITCTKWVWLNRRVPIWYEQIDFCRQLKRSIVYDGCCIFLKYRNTTRSYKINNTWKYRSFTLIPRVVGFLWQL